MRYIKTASFCTLIIGILMACCFQYVKDAREQNTFHSEFLSKDVRIDSNKANNSPVSPLHITRVYRKYTSKSLNVNINFVSDKHFILIQQDPKALLSWQYVQNIPSSFLLFQGSRAPPVVC
jgi:hypothetical protein